MNYVTIDFETAKYSRESVCSVGMVKYLDGKAADTFYSLIRPPVLYIRPDFTDIHCLTVDDVRDAPTFKDLWDSEIRPFIGNFPLAAHNAPFDMSVIRAALEWYELEIPALQYFCTQRLSRQTWPTLESYALTALAEQFGIVYNAHNALDDAMTFGKLVEMSTEKFGSASITELLNSALKAYLMHKVYEISENENPENLIRNIEIEFSDIYKQSERVSYEEDRILRFHSTAFLSGEENALNSVKSAIAKSDDNTTKVKWIKDFVHDLKETFYTIEIIEKKGETNNAIADALLLDTQNSMPLLIKLYHFHKNDENSISEIMKIVENILFKLCYRTEDYRTNSLPTIARHYVGNIANLKQVLLAYSRNGFQHWWKFTESCKNYFVRNNYHYSSSIKYVLWKYENYLRDKRRARLLTPNDFKNKYESKRKENTIDHITPQNPNFTKYTDEFNSDYLNNIGNLGLMVWGDNSSKKDNNPVEKIKLFDTIFFSNEEIKNVLETANTWGENEIRNRRDTLVEFIIDNWNLK